MYYEACDMVILEILLYVDELFIPLRVLKNYLCMFWINWRCSI